MAPTFAQVAARTTMKAMLYVRIGGLPYIFASEPQVWGSGGTVTIDSEDYTWSRTLMTNEIDSVGVEVDPKAGITVTGALGLHFAISGSQGDDASSDVWLDITHNGLHRTDRTYSTLTADLPIGETTTASTSGAAAWSGAGGFIYCGTETIEYGGKSGDNLTTLTRGRFGSVEQLHVASYDSILETGSGGPHISAEGPLVMAGRIVEVWIATGEIVDGTFTPYGAAPFSESDFEIYKGVIQHTGLSGLVGRVKLDTATLDVLLGRQAFTRLPEAFISVGDTPELAKNLITISEGSNRVNFRCTAISGSANIDASGPNSLRLVRPDGAGGSENVPDGRFSLGAVAGWIAFTIQQASGYGSAFSKLSVTLENDDSDKRVMKVTATPASGTAAIAFTLATDDDVLREMGWTEAQGSSSFSTATEITFNAQRRPPLLRLPVTGGVGRWFRYEDATGPDFTLTTGWEDDFGNAIGCYVMIGDHEIVKISAITLDSPVNGGVMTIGARRQAGTAMEEELYIELGTDSDERVPIRQVAFFPGCSSIRVLLYAMLGVLGDAENSDYDEGWRGCGAQIPEAFIDIGAFEALDLEATSQRNRNHCFTEAVSIREWFAPEAIAHQIFVSADSDATTGHKIRPRRVQAPVESDLGAATTRVIDANNLATEKGVEYDADEERLINVVEVETRYDNAKGAYMLKQTFRNGTSIATYAEAAALSLPLRGNQARFRVFEGAETERMIQQIFGAYSWPYVVVSFQLTSFESWLWSIGDAADITSTILPKITSVGRGWVNVLGKIYKLTRHFRKQGVFSTVTCVVRRSQGRRFGNWAPGARLTSKSSDTAWTAAANVFTAASDGVDLDGFAVGDVVDAITPGTTTHITATIASLVGNAIGFDGVGVTLPAPVYIVPVGHDDANITDAQKLVAFIGSWGPPAELDEAGGGTVAGFYLQ